MAKKRPHQYHVLCKHEHTKQIEMCQDCGEIITSPMNKIILVHESFTGDVKFWVSDA